MSYSKIVFGAVLGALLLVGQGMLAQTPGQAPSGEKKAEGSSGKKAEGPGGRRGERGEGPGGRRGEGPGGRFDPEQARQQRQEMMKQMLGATDEEWKVLGPKVEKVRTAQRELSSGGMPFGFGGRPPFGGPGGPGGAPGGQDSTAQSPVVKAANDLRTAMDDKSTSAEEIGKKLIALRQAREKAREELTKAQKELRELLTQRQEASLVLMGMLD